LANGNAYQSRQKVSGFKMAELSITFETGYFLAALPLVRVGQVSTLQTSTLQASTFYKHQHFTNINILQTSAFYKHQHFTNINISNINIANMNIASINIHHFKDQKFVDVEVFQYSLLRALKLDVEF
jgi:hypothetical protein